MSTWNPCADEIAKAVAVLTGVDIGEIKVEAPPRPELGDFAVGMFPVAKALREAPPQVAARIAAALQPAGFIASATALGPFVNIKVDRAAALRWVMEAALGAPGKQLVPQPGTDKTVCIDYSSPNISKHLAYHHIRSTMLGHALAHLHEALGYRVVGINHLGDWGTTHGMLLAAYAKWGSEAKYATLDVTALNDLYVRFRAEMKVDPALELEGRAWFKRLEDGDADARARWQQFKDISLAEFDAVYQLIGVRFDEVKGESDYEDKMPEVLDLVAQQGLSSESEGALVIELADEKIPLLLKTKDGTTLYATRDLAAALYRWRTYHFDRSLYVVDRGQALHFRQLFKALALMGFDWAARCEHIPFGLVRFGGKKTSSRGGEVMLLKDVFREAQERVKVVIASTSPDLDPATIDRTAQQVGIGAVVFANILPQRDKDVDFDFDKVLSLSGDSGPYLQYTVARCWAILRKAGNPAPTPPRYELLTTDAEWAVARRLLDFGGHVARAAASCEPHILAHYLLDLAGDFSRWYTAGNADAGLRVLCDDPDLRTARIELVRAFRDALTRGLKILGISAPEAM